MSRNVWTAIGTAVGIGGVIGGSLWYSRRASAATPPSGGTGSPETPDPAALDLAPLPRAQDVSGDLETNWGTTPVDLRPLFMQMEEAARMPGSGRLFSIYAFGESRFIPTAHNGDAENEQAERDASRRAWENGQDNNPPLRWAEEAADFGSGGLFGLLAPYFLWTGVPEVGERAPLLDAPPELMFQPRASAFAAVVYFQRIVKHYRVDDLADIRAGWASPSLLTTGRGGQRYQETRARFLEHAKTIGIDLNDTTTIPPKFDVSAWPGVLQVFAALVGTLPKELA
jgi:hypothetical protein